MEQIFALLHIDPIIALLVLAGGFFAKTYLTFGFFNRMSNAHKTLLVGSIFSAAYILVLWLKGSWTAELWTTFFFSYVATTSFYELLINPFIRWINKITGQPVDQP